MKPRRRQSARSGVRIIGGDWRGRRFEVEDAPGLRPTPDRVRETLFNWLAPLIAGAHCVDAFAGTGALGIEALSRGAAHCLFIEQDRRLASALEKRLAALGAGQSATVLCARWPEAADRLNAAVDIAFLDPPFAQPLLLPGLRALAPHLSAAHRIYAEYDAQQSPDWPVGWAVLKSRRAGQVGYSLLQQQPDGPCPHD